MKPIEIEGFSARHPHGRVGRREERQAGWPSDMPTRVFASVCHIFDQTSHCPFPSVDIDRIGGKPLPRPGSLLSLRLRILEPKPLPPKQL
jgi:hypothetical protein